MNTQARAIASGIDRVGIRFVLGVLILTFLVGTLGFVGTLRHYVLYHLVCRMCLLNVSSFIDYVHLPFVINSIL